MIYFYEKHSDELYRYYPPAPSRSIINIPFFVSRGYVVFVPDIHYTVGHPGEDAYNAIVAGAEALARNAWIDKANMAIQGQSWGGYQVSYLVMRTDMFKAVGADWKYFICHIRYKTFTNIKLIYLFYLF